MVARLVGPVILSRGRGISGGDGSAGGDGAERTCCGGAVGMARSFGRVPDKRSAQGLRRLVKSWSQSWTRSMARSGSTRKVSSKEQPLVSSIMRTCW